MSFNLKSWIQSVEAKAAALFTSVGMELKTVLLPAAIRVTNALKTITDLDGLDVIGHLIGAAGPAAEEQVKAALPKVIADLQLAQAFLASNPTPEDLINKVVSIAVGLTGNARTAFLIEFSGRLATELANGKLTVQESILLSQDLYTQLKVPAPAPVATPAA